jgi:hypothetical protein
MRTITGSPTMAARFRDFVVSPVDFIIESRYHEIKPMNSHGLNLEGLHHNHD